MSTPISKFALAAALLLAACAPESGAPQGASVECALGEGAPLNDDCVLEIAAGGGLTIHHPDATFQRLRFDAQTGALTVADGAQDLVLDPDPSAGMIEFAIGAARYRVERAALLNAQQ